MLVIIVMLFSCKKEDEFVPTQKKEQRIPNGTWDVILSINDSILISEESYLIENLIDAINGNYDVAGEVIRFPHISVIYYFDSLNFPESKSRASGVLPTGEYQGQIFRITNLQVEPGDNYILGTERSYIFVCSGPQKQKIYFFCKKRKEISYNPRLLKSGVFYFFSRFHFDSIFHNTLFLFFQVSM